MARGSRKRCPSERIAGIDRSPSAPCRTAFVARSCATGTAGTDSACVFPSCGGVSARRSTATESLGSHLPVIICTARDGRTADDRADAGGDVVRLERSNEMRYAFIISNALIATPTTPTNDDVATMARRNLPRRVAVIASLRASSHCRVMLKIRLLGLRLLQDATCFGK